MVPVDITFDATGNLIIADHGKDRIRRVGVDGVITTIAGGQATAGTLFSPTTVAASDGSVYFSGGDSRSVTRVDAAGTLIRIGGDGEYGDDGDAGLPWTPRSTPTTSPSTATATSTSPTGSTTGSASSAHRERLPPRPARDSRLRWRRWAGDQGQDRRPDEDGLRRRRRSLRRRHRQRRGPAHRRRGHHHHGGRGRVRGGRRSGVRPVLAPPHRRAGQEPCRPSRTVGSPDRGRRRPLRLRGRRRPATAAAMRWPTALAFDRAGAPGCIFAEPSPTWSSTVWEPSTSAASPLVGDTRTDPHGPIAGHRRAAQLHDNQHHHVDEHIDHAAFPAARRPLQPAGPGRILDTRDGTGGSLRLSGAEPPISPAVTGVGGVPAAGVSAVVLNVAVTQLTLASHLTVYPNGTARPPTSNLNFVANQTVSNLVVAKVSADGKAAVFNTAGSTHVVFDVVAWYSGPTARPAPGGRHFSSRAEARQDGHAGVVETVVRSLLVGAGLLALTWAVLVVLARRLPAGAAKDLASVLPSCVTTAGRLSRDPRVPRRAKLVVGFAALWVLSPIDLVPEFLPVIGPLDDVVVVAVALRYAARRIPRQVLCEAWPGEMRVLDRLVPFADCG